jgi:hypothetical protein
MVKKTFRLNNLTMHAKNKGNAIFFKKRWNTPHQNEHWFFSQAFGLLVFY